MSAKAFSSPHALFDRTALRFVLVLTAFVINQHWLITLVAVVLALGVIHPALALFQRLYRDILRPLGWLRPDLHEEDAAPHRFAQGVGAGVLLLATLSL